MDPFSLFIYLTVLALLAAYFVAIALCKRYPAVADNVASWTGLRPCQHGCYEWASRTSDEAFRTVCDTSLFCCSGCTSRHTGALDAQETANSDQDTLNDVTPNGMVCEHDGANVAMICIVLHDEEGEIVYFRCGVCDEIACRDNHGEPRYMTGTELARLQRISFNSAVRSNMEPLLSWPAAGKPPVDDRQWPTTQNLS